MKIDGKAWHTTSISRSIRKKTRRKTSILTLRIVKLDEVSHETLVLMHIPTCFMVSKVILRGRRMYFCHVFKRCVALFVAGAALRRRPMSLCVAGGNTLDVSFVACFLRTALSAVREEVSNSVAGATFCDMTCRRMPGTILILLRVFCESTCPKRCCVAGAMLLPRDALYFSWQAQRFADVQCHYAWQGAVLLEVCCCVFSANLIVSAARSGDTVQIP